MRPTTIPPRAARLGLGLLATLVTAGLLAWNLGRPAFWIDESASVVATQRSLPDLLHLLRGADTPLVPYYLVLKPAAALATALGAPVEVAYRWPSLAAVALTAGLLATWLARRTSSALALAATAVLLMSAGVSRYGQEARPYAFTALLAVLATATWWRLVAATDRAGRVRFCLLYAAAVAALACVHLLAATLVAAHLVAALVLPPTVSRWRSVLLTGLSAALGAVVSAPFTLLAARNAVGPSTRTPATPERMWQTLNQAFTWSDPWLGVGAVMLLAAVGVGGLALRRYRTITVIALTWAVVPPVLLVPAMLVKPTLLRLRYLVFVIPGWAIMGGLGVLVLATVVHAGLARLIPAAGSRVAAVPRVAALTVGLVVVGLAGWSQQPSLTAVRGPAGHGEDSRPVLAAATSPPDSTLPIMASSRIAVTMLAAYDRGLENRLVGSYVQRSNRSVWPVLQSVTQRRAELERHPRVYLVIRNSLDGGCRRHRGETSRAFLTRCMPRPLAAMGYRVVQARGGGLAYTGGVAQRP